MIPHVTDEIKSRIKEAAQGSELIIVEIGGTVGDIEGLPFLEAVRQLRTELGSQNSALILQQLGLSAEKPDLKAWLQMLKNLKNPSKATRIAVVGKYVDLKESYKSLHEAIVHGGIANSCGVEIVYVDSEKLNEKNLSTALQNVFGILVPGGFGERGIEGKLLAIKYAREKSIPYFGICYGMQLACIEFARNVCGIKDATSREWASEKERVGNFVIDIMNDQRNLSKKGGTMRLGSYSCSLSPHSKAHQIYKAKVVFERHRHRFEFNNKFKSLFEKKGMNCVGICQERDLVEIVELVDHPWFVGVQFHPEFKSKPLEPHPLFVHFVRASLKRNEMFEGRSAKRLAKTSVVENKI